MGSPQVEFAVISESPAVQKSSEEGKIPLKAEQLNELRRALAAKRCTNAYLFLFGNFWKQECERPKKELNVALINIECERKLTINEATLSTAASQNTKSSAVYQKRSNICSRAALRKQISDKSILVKLTSYFISFYDNCLSFAHLFLFRDMP